MQNDKAEILQDLAEKRQEAVKQSAHWGEGMYATTAVSLAALAAKDWRDAEGKWGEFLKIKNPLRIFKTPVSAVVSTTLIATFALTAAVGIAKASKAKAYQESIAAVSRIPEPVASPEPVTQENQDKSWTASEVERGKEATVLSKA